MIANDTACLIKTVFVVIHLFCLFFNQLEFIHTCWRSPVSLHNLSTRVIFLFSTWWWMDCLLKKSTPCTSVICLHTGKGAVNIYLFKGLTLRRGNFLLIWIWFPVLEMVPKVIVPFQVLVHVDSTLGVCTHSFAYWKHWLEKETFLFFFFSFNLHQN